MNSKWNMILRLIAVFVAGSLLSGCSTSAMPSATAIETPASGPFTKSIAESPPPGSLVEETEHFTIYYPEGDESSANFIGIVLEDHLMRTSMDLGFRPQEKVKVYIYPDLGVFHETIELPEAPEWVVATGYGGGIQMVTPRLISTYLFEKTIVHELTHSLQGEINPQAPFWMIEGLAMYEAGMFEGVEETIRQCIEADNIPTIGSLETMTSEEEFAQAGVFAIGYTVVEFVV